MTGPPERKLRGKKEGQRGTLQIIPEFAQLQQMRVQCTLAECIICVAMLHMIGLRRN